MNNIGYANSKEIKRVQYYAEQIITKLRAQLKKEHFTFSHQLVGSGKLKLVTKNGNNFDLDYNLIFHITSKKNQTIKPNIKQKIVTLMNHNSSEHERAKESTSVVHIITFGNNENTKINIDLGIFISKNKISSLIIGKNNQYKLEQRKKYQEQRNKFKLLSPKERHKFKTIYLEKKKINKSPKLSSYLVFVETMNEIGV